MCKTMLTTNVNYKHFRMEVLEIVICLTLFRINFNIFAF